MEFRKLFLKDLPQAKKVWKTCFEDSDDFIDAYFHYVANIDQGLGAFEGDRLLSDLFMLNFRANICGSVFDATFLAGCATLPEARNRDLMKRLVRHALQDMAARGVTVSFLHPFLHAFYRKFGYETVAYVKRNDIAPELTRAEQSVTIYHSMEHLPIKELGQAYAVYTQTFDNFFIRSHHRMRAWMELLFADGGYAAVLSGGEYPAYALYYLEKGRAEVFELVFFERNQANSLLNAIDAQHCSYFLPAGAGKPLNSDEFTMMRVVDPKTMLRHCTYRKSAPPFVIDIDDPFLENHYRLRVIPGAADVALVSDTDAPVDIETDVNGLAVMLTGTFDRPICPSVEEIFEQKASCYFETY